MITLSAVRQTVIDWIEDDSDTDLIDRTINTQLRFLCRGNTFESLIETADVTPDSSGIIKAPAACGAIISIFNQTDVETMPTIEFNPIAHRDVTSRPRTSNYKYRPIGGTKTNGESGIILSGAVGDTTLLYASGTAVTDDMEGKELKLSGDPTRYIVTGAAAGTSLDVFPPLRVSATGGVSGIIDPMGQKQYVLLDPSGAPYTQAVTIDYKIDHPPLISNDDELIVPMERTLSLMVVQQFLQSAKYDVDAQRLAESVYEAHHIEFGDEPTAIQDSAPQNTMFAFRSKRGNGRSRYSRR